MKMELEEDVIVLKAPITATTLMRQLPGARHNASKQLWTLPLSWTSCVTARGVLGSQLEIGPELAAWSREEYENRIKPALYLREAKDTPEDWEPVFAELEAEQELKLYPFQRTGAAFLATAGSAILGDEMGTGKTPQTIRALQLVGNPFPVLVVCPNSVKRVWAKQLREWWPGARTLISPSGTVEATKAAEQVLEGNTDILIVNYDALSNLSRLASYGSIRLQGCSNCEKGSDRSPAKCQREPKVLNNIPWKTVIADEAHRIKNPSAQWTRALWAVGDGAEHRFALTGTPIANSPDDLWSVLRFIAPKEYPSKMKWVERYVLTVPNPWSGFPESVSLRPEMREEFDKAFLPRFIRRPKAAVLPDLPEKTYERREVTLAGKQTKAYKTLKEEMVAAVDNGTIFTTNPLESLIRLRQLASAFGKVDEDGKLTLSEPSTKLDVLEEVLEELGDRQAVIFAESRQLIELAKARLEKAGHTVSMLVGGMEETARGQSQNDFETGRSKYILATVGAGGEGVDGLQVADTLIFLQRPWSSVLDKQAEDRIHRHGQTAEKVTIIDLVTVATVEDQVLKALADKAGKLEDLVKDADTVRRWLT